MMKRRYRKMNNFICNIFGKSWQPVNKSRPVTCCGIIGIIFGKISISTLDVYLEQRNIPGLAEACYE